MKKTCNLTKKALSRAGLIVLALVLVLMTFSSLITRAKAFNEDEHDGEMYTSDTTPTPVIVSFIGAFVKKGDLTGIRFGLTYDEKNEGVDGFPQKIQIEVFSSDSQIMNQDIKVDDITADTEWTEYNGKRLYLIEIHTTSYYGEMVLVAYSVNNGGSKEYADSITRSIYSTWNEALKGSEFIDIDTYNEVTRRAELVTKYGIDEAKSILKTEVERDSLKEANAELRSANADLTEKNGALEKENASIKEENEALKEKNNELSKGDAVTQFINYLFGTELAPVYCHLIIAGAVVVLVLLITGVAFGVKRR